MEAIGLWLLWQALLAPYAVCFHDARGFRRFVEWITGLALKMEQYRLGESFINAVAEKRGIKFANLIWEGPDKLPTLDELRNPQTWIDRVAPD